MGATVTRIVDIADERRSIIAYTTLRLALFNHAHASWMNLQLRYHLEVAEDEISDRVRRDVRPLELTSAKRS